MTGLPLEAMCLPCPLKKFGKGDINKDLEIYSLTLLPFAFLSHLNHFC